MCKYCDSWLEHDTLYQENAYSDLMIGSALGRPAMKILNIRSGCPKYADCSAKGTPVSIAYAINYCPECGRLLNEKGTGA